MQIHTGFIAQISTEEKSNLVSSASKTAQTQDEVDS